MFQKQGARVPGSVVASGGVLWLAKLIVIVSTGGRVVDDGAAGAFYLLGLLVLAAGAALLGYWLAERYSVLMRVGAGVAGVVGFIVLFQILDALGSSLVGDRGPVYAADEVGIFLTAILALAVGVWLWITAESGSEARVMSRS